MQDENESQLGHTLTSGLSRRQFLEAAGALAAFPALTLAQAAAPAGPRIRVGLIGCGHRGSWMAGLFKKHGGFEIVAGADYFPDRAEALAAQFSLPAGRCFSTLSGYKRLLELKDVDAIIVETPPYFHPEHAAAAVEAGKHVFVAKPVAVDVPGCQTIARSGRKATAGKKVFLVDFQTRSTRFYQEAIRRVHAGALGEICFGNAFYHSSQLALENSLREELTREALRLRPRGQDTPPERRLRQWFIDARISGDIIVEQNVHTLDVMNWVMRVPPLECAGSSSRRGRKDRGDCHGSYACHYRYPDDVGITFSSKQYPVEIPGEGIIVNIFGSTGALLTNYGGEVMIRAGKENFYRGGKTTDIYLSGVVNNIARFHELITKENYANETVDPSVQSTLIAIMGRTATRKRAVVTWEELTGNSEKIDAGLEGLKA